MSASATVFALVLARCAGFIARAPGFSHPQVPRIVRAALAFVLTLGLAPTIALGRALPTGALAAALLSEVAIGFAIGLGASVLYEGVSAGAHALDDYIGIRGQNPGITTVGGAGLGPAWQLLFVAGFFVLDGYQVLLAIFADVFARLPPGAVVSAHDWYALATSLPGTVMRAAVLVAGPAVVLAFVVQLGLGAIARVVPRFSSLQISYPLAFGVAAAASVVAMPLLFPLSGRAWLDLPMLHR